MFLQVAFGTFKLDDSSLSPCVDTRTIVRCKALQLPDLAHSSLSCHQDLLHGDAIQSRTHLYPASLGSVSFLLEACLMWCLPNVVLASYGGVRYVSPSFYPTNIFLLHIPQTLNFKSPWRILVSPSTKSLTCSVPIAK